MSTSAPSATPGATSSGDESPRQPAFVTTHWSVVLAAGGSDTPGARAAMEELCRTYWYLRERYQQHGKAAVFDALKPCLIGSRETQPYAVLAAKA